MANTPQNRSSEQMEREVNRLLAQLAHAGAEPIAARRASGGTPAPHSAGKPRSSGATRTVTAAPRWAAAGLWGRVVLGLALGALMMQWPYPHGCGWALLRYLGAVATVLLAGAWIAFASWRLRHGVAHVLSLILFFWGIVLAAEQVLPRIGYAADPANWVCGGD